MKRAFEMKARVDYPIKVVERTSFQFGEKSKMRNPTLYHKEK